jgi:REP element-mobilizing transposase RayT
MPTKKRITIPGACTHIMARGIDGASLFEDDADRRVLLDLLKRGIARSGVLCYAWCLMDNHYHLVIRCGDKPLDSMMRALNASYARYFNRKRQRHGYVFQDRYKSIVTQDQRYLEELIRYVHLNPIRAGLCADLDELARYPWCGHGVLMGTHECAFQATTAILCRFGRSAREGRDNYLDFLRQGLGEINTDWLVDKVRLSNAGVERKDQPGCWVIGDREFVVAVTAKHRERLALTRAAREQWDIGDVAERMAAEAGVSVADLRRRGRKSAGIACRKKFAYICCRVLQIPVIGVASFLGTSGPAVSWAIREGEKLVTAEDVRKWTILPPG